MVGRSVKGLNGGASRTVSAYEQIKSAIVDGRLAAGSPLIEVALAEMCGVSRTPVREALTRLEDNGLIVRGPSGLVVREHSPEEVLDIYETRIALEATAARVAAERRTSYDLIALRRLTGTIEAMTTPTATEMAQANHDFHHAVWQTGRNKSLIDLLERLGQHLSLYSATTLVAPGRWEQSNEQHRLIVDAIEARDGVRAGELATEHFTIARDIRLRIYENG